MQRSDFSYVLPPHLIAQFPSKLRRGSRLLNVRAGQLQNLQFADFPQLLRKGDLLVFNDTRVIPARLWGHKSTGGRVEILVERILNERCCLAQLRASRLPKIGMEIGLDQGFRVQVVQKKGAFFELSVVNSVSLLEILDRVGHVPLPPYVQRPDQGWDQERYQTVYACHPGAVAAPTAGLHFDEEMMCQLQSLGVELGFVTLHVGAGTFSPIRVEALEQHEMHAEYVKVSGELCQQVKATQERGGRVIAVGTTSVRALESASVTGQIQPLTGETKLFIRPGYSFRTVDALLTNFHLPESTLLILVCALAGTATVLTAYQYAVAQGYRFFSYGDAMFLERAPLAQQGYQDDDYSQ